MIQIDMEMPKSCEHCPFSSCKGRLNGFYCDVTTFDVDIESKERDADCPLKEVGECKLTEEDFIELNDRFGHFVSNIVRDMYLGKNERWKTC